MAEPNLYLYDATTAEQATTADSSGMDVYFPDDIDGWTDVLDCRHPPYTGQSIAENCTFAKRVNKKYILVDDSQIAHETPPVDEPPS